jgi:hypothetical protein
VLNMDIASIKVEDLRSSGPSAAPGAVSMVVFPAQQKRPGAKGESAGLPV